MPAPSPLSIAASSVQRLVKEEAYYHKELAGQQVRVDKLEGQIKEKSADLDENAEYLLKQEVGKNPSPPLHIPPPFSCSSHCVRSNIDHVKTETSHGADKISV